MKEKIDKLRSSIESSEHDDAEIVAALERLDDQTRDHPGKVLIQEELDKTTLNLDSEDLMDGYISGSWKTLGERLEEWEEEHPGVTLVIGNIARAFAVAGL